MCHRQKTKEHAKKTNYYRKDNSERCKAYRKKYKEKIRIKKREYERNRLKTNPAYKMRKAVSTNVYVTLKSKGIHKRGRSFWAQANYTPQELMEHLQKQFWYGMSWENYGEWHLDHIKPQSSYDIRDFGDGEFMDCWELKNLQPLWKEDNLLKGKTFSKET